MKLPTFSNEMMIIDFICNYNVHHIKYLHKSFSFNYYLDVFSFTLHVKYIIAVILDP